MKNIELKARLADRIAAIRTAASLGASLRGEIHQIDTYFRVAKGRLKLREADPGVDELVFYQREDVTGPKGCEYVLHPAEPTLKPILEQALGVIAVVDKRRTLYIWENVRIHLDEVVALGSFIEFEAVLDEEHDDADGHAKLQRLIEVFGLKQDDMESGSYLDLALDRA